MFKKTKKTWFRVKDSLFNLNKIRNISKQNDNIIKIDFDAGNYALITFEDKEQAHDFFETIWKHLDE